MKKLFLLLSFLLLSAAIPGSTYARTAGNLTVAATTTCAAPTGGTAFIIQSIDTNIGGVTFAVTTNAGGNTISWFGSADGGTTWVALNATPSNSTTAATSTTGTGTWQANVAGYTHVCMEISSLVSGSNNVSINPSSASARSGGGGGGSGTVTSVSGTANQIDVATGTTTPVVSLDPAFQFSSTAAGALTNAPFLFTGAPVTGGSGTTTVPLIYGNSGAANPTTWATVGTFLGFNAPSGWTGVFLDYHISGGGSLFSVSGTSGNVTTSGTVTAGSNVLSGGVVGANNASLWNGATNGVWKAENFAASGFTRLSLGPDTTSFPALCPSGTTLQIMVAGACTTFTTAEAATVEATTSFSANGTAGLSTSSLCSATFTSSEGIVTVCTAASDPRLKVFGAYRHGLDTIMRIEPIHFHWNATGLRLNSMSAKDNPEQIGFSAKNIYGVMPEAVGTERFEGVDYFSLPQGDRPIVAALVNAVQEQQKEIQDLRAEIAALKK